MIYPFPPPRFNIELPAPQITITLDTPSKGDFYALTAGTDPVKILSRYTDAPLTGVTAAVLAIRYIEQLKAYREANMDFMEVPHTIDFGDTGTKTDKLPCITMAERMVYEHSGLTARSYILCKRKIWDRAQPTVLEEVRPLFCHIYCTSKWP